MAAAIPSVVYGFASAANWVRPFMPTVYATRTQMPISLWQQHFADPQHSVDILVLAATFLFDTLDGFVDTLVDAAGRGVAVRMLVGDPDGPSLTLRGEEEDIGEAVIARCRTTVELLAPRASTPGLQIRTHQTTLYSSIFRVDDRHDRELSHLWLAGSQQSGHGVRAVR